MSKPAWALSRARTYTHRAAARRRHIRSGEFDLVHLHFLNRFTDALAALPHPLAISVHDVLPHQLRIGVRGELIVHQRLYSRADLLIVHHRHLADELVRRFKLDSGRIHVVPMQVFPVRDPSPNPPDGPPMFLLFGAMRKNKGMDVVARALRRIPDADIRVVIAGHGDAELEEAARQLAVDDPRVTTELRSVSHERKRELFNDCSVVLLPYTSFESQSAVLHDAYGHFRPVIATEVGALGHTVREDGTGIVIAPDDDDALARAMLDALDTTSWRSWSEAGRAIATERSPGVLGPRLRAVYDEVL